MIKLSIYHHRLPPQITIKNGMIVGADGLNGQHVRGLAMVEFPIS